MKEPNFSCPYFDEILKTLAVIDNKCNEIQHICDAGYSFTEISLCSQEIQQEMAWVESDIERCRDINQKLRDWGKDLEKKLETK
jgi:hypothetical protein